MVHNEANKVDDPTVSFDHEFSLPPAQLQHLSPELRSPIPKRTILLFTLFLFWR